MSRHVLVEYVVRIVLVKDGYPENARMDAALVNASGCAPEIRAAIEDLIRDRPALDGFDVEIAAAK